MPQIRLFQNRTGSSTVFLSMVFVAMSILIAAAIAVSREQVAVSHAKVYGRLWNKAILSEYDVHLLEDYGILAYHGLDADVAKKLSFYVNYAMKGRLRASLGNPSANLDGYDMSKPAVFLRALEDAFAAEAAEQVIAGNERIPRDAATLAEASGASEQSLAFGTRKIANRVVLSTLPSQGAEEAFDAEEILEGIESGSLGDKLKNAGAETAAELLFIRKYLGNHMTTASTQETYFMNEWEYLVKGSPEDRENFEACKRRIYLIRNGLNLAALYKDTEKRDAVLAIAEIITPGPAALLTQAVILEVWAALEADADLDALLDGERVPMIKTAGTWKISLESVLSSERMAEKLDEEAQRLLEENKGEIKDSGEGLSKQAEGQSYEDYVFFLILLCDSDVRIRRIMDMVQINMKYRYYEDFNFAEYHYGIRSNLRVNGKSYEIADAYR